MQDLVDGPKEMQGTKTQPEDQGERMQELEDVEEKDAITEFDDSDVWMAAPRPRRTSWRHPGNRQVRES